MKILSSSLCVEKANNIAPDMTLDDIKIKTLLTLLKTKVTHSNVNYEQVPSSSKIFFIYTILLEGNISSGKHVRAMNTPLNPTFI